MTMLQTFEDYCRRLRGEADKASPETEASEHFSHLHAFNFGRSVARLEHAREAFWVRLRWLLLGTAVGVSLAAAYLQVFLTERILQFTK
jgi:hypothetical protein